METSNQVNPNTLYTEMETLHKDIISIYNDVVSVANQLGFAIPMNPESDCVGLESSETTVRSTLRNIKKVVQETKDWSKNLSENVR